MPLLLADFIYSRDCKLNLRKTVDTTDKYTPALHGAAGRFDTAWCNMAQNHLLNLSVSVSQFFPAVLRD